MADNGFLGNDPHDMQDLMNKIDHAVSEIQQVTSTLDAKAQSVRWNGSDADNFKQSEWPSHKSALARVVDGLTTVKSRVAQQKAQQESTSSN
jgi:hypothetical protein